MPVVSFKPIFSICLLSHKLLFKNYVLPQDAYLEFTVRTGVKPRCLVLRGNLFVVLSLVMLRLQSYCRPRVIREVLYSYSFKRASQKFVAKISD